MELLIFKLKSGIKIKPSHKGLFTAYCHGKVTDECILKGKNSSNPAIRKRATFAANSRKWKHEEGGILRFLLEGGKNASPAKTSWLKSALGEAKDAIKGALPGLASDLLKGGINSLFGSNSSSELVNLSPMETMREQDTNLAADFVLSLLNENPIFNAPNYGEIINTNPDLNRHINWQLRSNELIKLANQLYYRNKMLETQKIMNLGKRITEGANYLSNLFAQ